jgi:site-specific recombinase XerD
MPNDQLNRCSPDSYGYSTTNLLDLHPQYSGVAIQSSVRDLEQLSSKLKETGDRHAADRVDQIIMSLLEKKIFKKLVTQSRSQQRRFHAIADLYSISE